MSTKIIFTLFLLISFPFIIYAQFNPGNKIIIKRFNTINSVVYTYGSVEFYFQRDTLIKYLDKAFVNASDTSYSVLQKALNVKTRFNINDTTIYNIQTSYEDMTIPLNHYTEAMRRIAPYLLANGRGMVYNKIKKHFENTIYLYWRLDMDIRGPHEDFDFYYPNKKLFYHSRIINPWWY